MAYRVYLTDALQIVGENTAKQSGGRYLERRYYDLINPKPVDTRTGDEIIADIIAKISQL